MSSAPALKLDWCSHAAAMYAVTTWHYSRSLPTPPLLKIGVWEHGQFIGAVLFGRGANNNMYKPYGVGVTEACELVRIALTSHHAPVSRIGAIALKLLRASNPKLRLVVSYADPGHDHHGGIYQAMNWIYTGQTAPDAQYIDATGRAWHSRQVSSTGIKRQYGTPRSVPRHDACTKIPLEGKHRYLYPLDAAMRAQIAPLAQPYPRAARIDSDAPGLQPGEGGATPTAALHIPTEVQP